MGPVVYPELVTGREDGFSQGPWTVVRGTASRGGASCNLTERVLEIPLGGDATARAVRAHELMHIRVSPFQAEWSSWSGDVSARALECAEEFRVNTLLTRLGFDTSLLRDGTEKVGARRLADAGDWSEALCFLMAVVGTGGERDYLAGVRGSQPAWLAGLRAVRKRTQAMMAALSTSEIGATLPGDDGVPRGYATTIAIARLIDQARHARAPDDAESLRQFRRSLEPGGRRAASGRFAPLHFDASLRGHHRARGLAPRTQRPSLGGTVMRYPSRLLTDEQMRAFGSKRRRHGGVVVIDQSGSMDIAAVDLETLLRRAPDALVVGYSHRPGDLGTTPNAWVLAARGRVAASAPAGNVGNGVDGPILRWAVARAGNSGPVVWVTDGQITDSNDHPDDALSEECALLVRKHRISLVREVAEAGGALTCHRPFVPSNFGRVGRKLMEIGTRKGI